MATTVSNQLPCNEPKFASRRTWYSPETGIYTSKHAPLELPSDPFLDVVSHIFSHQHNGVSALIDSSSACSISYSDLFPLVKSTAFGLHKMGVLQGDVVLLLIPNSIFYPIVFLGVLYLGAIVTPLNPRSHISEIHKQIAECGVSMAFTSQDKVKKLPPLGIPIIGVPGNFKDLKCSDYSVFYNLVSGNSGLFRGRTFDNKNIEDFIHTLPNVDFIQGYGMTESTAVGTRGFNTEKFRNYSSIGLLAPNMEAKVVDWKTGAFMPPGSSGELWLRGPSIMTGYLNNEEATMSTIDKDGWLHTGDVGWFDQDGYIHLSDRLKDIIKYKGYQISPADLEAVLILHPEIVDVAIIGVNDEETGEIPVAFVVRKVGSTLSQKTILDYVVQQVAPYKKVRKVVFTDSIPRSAAGKILKRQLRRNYLTSKL
ncbi:hypothetical protein K1719_045762 [Acacia pycnantha]|nr:hypothetical protein K1719_045762 [Acacia pycnantha]